MQLNLEDDIFKKAIYSPHHKLDSAIENSINKKDTIDYSSTEDELLGMVRIDTERMDKALSSPTYQLPSGLSVEQIIEYIQNIAKQNK